MGGYDTDDRLGENTASPSLLRGLVLLVGMIGLAVLAALLPLLDRGDLGFALAEGGTVLMRLPAWLVLGAAAGAGLGLIGLLWAMVMDRRLHAALAFALEWLRSHPLSGLGMLVVVGLGSIDFYELLYDPFLKKWGPDGHGGLRAWMLREDLQSWMFLAAATLGALALSSVWRSQPLTPLTRPGFWTARSWWALAALVPLVLGAAMCRWALDGIPHFSDALTYLMQGRTIWSGQLWLPKPLHPELWIHSLFFVTDQQHVAADTGRWFYEGTRFFGKYPLGWPAIVGTFDHFNLLFAANATLAGLAAVLTGLTARQVTASRRLPILAALLFGLSPWVWFSGAALASHVASTCALWAFLWLTLRAVNMANRGSNGVVSALGAGLALGAAVLIRPGDAANFALPVMPLVAWLMVAALWKRKEAKANWLVLGPVMAAGVAVGVGIYLWSNAQTTGHALMSPYALEPRFKEDWNTPLHMLGRAAFQWVELNGRFPGWGIGAMTVGILGCLIALAGRKGPARPSAEVRDCASAELWRGSLLLILACATVFFLFNTAFGFTNVWWGPRWLLPVAPALAILGAVVVDAAIGALGSTEPRQRSAATLGLALLLAGVTLGLTVRYPVQWWFHTLLPPHGVSAQPHRQALAAGIRNAVIAMPTDGVYPPRDARAGMAFMTVSDRGFDANDIIYVRAISGWEAAAKSMYPDREFYELQLDPASPGKFRFQQISAPAAISP